MYSPKKNNKSRNLLKTFCKYQTLNTTAQTRNTVMNTAVDGSYNNSREIQA